MKVLLVGNETGGFLQFNLEDDNDIRLRGTTVNISVESLRQDHNAADVFSLMTKILRNRDLGEVA